MYLYILQEMMKFHHWHRRCFAWMASFVYFFHQIDALINIIFIHIAYWKPKWQYWCITSSDWKTVRGILTRKESKIASFPGPAHLFVAVRKSGRPWYLFPHEYDVIDKRQKILSKKWSFIYCSANSRIHVILCNNVHSKFTLYCANYFFQASRSWTLQANPSTQIPGGITSQLCKLHIVSCSRVIIVESVCMCQFLCNRLYTGF